MLFKFTTTATNHEQGWHDTVTEYVFSYSFDHAKAHIIGRLESAGWTVDKIQGYRIHFEDLRDSCDRTTV